MAQMPSMKEGGGERDAAMAVRLPEPLEQYRAKVLRKEVYRLKLKVVRRGDALNDHKEGYMALLRQHQHQQSSLIACEGDIRGDGIWMKPRHDANAAESAARQGDGASGREDSYVADEAKAEGTRERQGDEGYDTEVDARWGGVCGLSMQKPVLSDVLTPAPPRPQRLVSTGPSQGHDSIQDSTTGGDIRQAANSASMQTPVLSGIRMAVPPRPQCLASPVAVQHGGKVPDSVDVCGIHSATIQVVDCSLESVVRLVSSPHFRMRLGSLYELLLQRDQLQAADDYSVPSEIYNPKGSEEARRFWLDIASAMNPDSHGLEFLATDAFAKWTVVCTHLDVVEGGTQETACSSPLPLKQYLNDPQTKLEMRNAVQHLREAIAAWPPLGEFVRCIKHPSTVPASTTSWLQEKQQGHNRSGNHGGELPMSRNLPEVITDEDSSSSADVEPYSCSNTIPIDHEQHQERESESNWDVGEANCRSQLEPGSAPAIVPNEATSCPDFACNDFTKATPRKANLQGYTSLSKIKRALMLEQLATARFQRQIETQKYWEDRLAISKRKISDLDRELQAQTREDAVALKKERDFYGRERKRALREVIAEKKWA